MLRQALSNKPDLKLSILTDALRGTREFPRASCATLLAGLIKEFGCHRVEISMFHTPTLYGIRKALIPRRFDEGWGLQHMKLYGFDDEIILSGANLSNDYFTDRQDRYHVFSSTELTRFYERLHDAITSVSYSMTISDTHSGYTLSWQSRTCPEPTRYPKAYRKYTSNLLRELVRPRFLNQCQFTFDKPPSTIIYPLVQMTPLLGPNQSTEQPCVNAVLDMLSQSDHRDTIWHFTAGYFNVFDDYRSRLLKALGNGTIITASPDANGFYRSPGPSGMLAAAYTLLSKRFLEDVQKAGKSSSIRIEEWRRGSFGTPGRWTYHAKGLWIQPSSSETLAPSLTFLGSSNLTRRSQSLDLEATAILITADRNLQTELATEVTNLQSNSAQVSIKDLGQPIRRANLMTRFSLWLCQGML